MYTIYDISLHNIKITAIIPFEKSEYQTQLCTMDFREPPVPLKGRGHSSVCNGSFLLKERPVGFKGKTGICNHLNFNFLLNQNSVPVTHGIFSNKHDGICRTKRQSVYNKFQQFKIQIPWLSHVCHQAISGEVYVCPVRTKFRTSIAQQSTFKALHSNPPLPPHSHLSLPASIIRSSSARRLLERDRKYLFCSSQPKAGQEPGSL